MHLQTLFLNYIRKVFLSAVSVGFMSDYKANEYDDKTDTYHINKMELLELSAVPVPANPNALAQRAVKAFEKNVINENELNWFKDKLVLCEKDNNKPEQMLSDNEIFPLLDGVEKMDQNVLNEVLFDDDFQENKNIDNDMEKILKRLEDLEKKSEDLENALNDFNKTMNELINKNEAMENVKQVKNHLKDILNGSR